ncbi:hypothetical protein WR25_16181 [Diploscapter pachys]|uniref:Uncharacterized protein n=1 Tax=Diploscapter pachys TaxID=2018661 RepID=A0A2A2KTT3_9BILA|nr:hypothetical protein WR25_16181 [Diploscapter pachys]
MEAEEYFATFEQLHEGDSPHAATHLPLRVSESCGISKIVWSSFDFMSGPEMNFVWEVSSNSSTGSPNLSGEENSISDAASLDSSLSTASAAYEDIDDPLQEGLTSFDNFDDSLIDSAYSAYFPMGVPDAMSYGKLKYLDDYMTESTSTCATAKTLDDSRVSSCTFSPPPCTLEEEHAASPLYDLLTGTPTSNEMNVLAALTLSNEHHDTEESNEFGESSSSNVSVRTLGKKNKPEEETATTKDAAELKKSIIEEEDKNHALTTSCVDSGIGGTISTHSELSALCTSPTVEADLAIVSQRIEAEESRDRTDTEFSSAAQSGVGLLEQPFDCSFEGTSDESFVAKFILAEQICSTQMPSNPLMHKVMLIPYRRIVVASYIFSVELSSRKRSAEANRSIHAISLILDSKRCDWYTQRQQFFEQVIMDSVPRIKASLSHEELDDVLVRATQELSRLLSLLGYLERFPLISQARPLMIKNTMFASRKVSEDRLLAKAITGILQSQGHCVIVGSDQLAVSKLLQTLALFVPEEWQWCCLRPYRHKYNPYIRLQAVRRKELEAVIQFGVQSMWPICVIDIDRSVVCISASINRHRHLRAKQEEISLQQIQGEHSRGFVPKLELMNCRAMESVYTFLRRMDQLPMEESARKGFVDQFLLHIDNTAHAFIAYVKEMTKPLDNEKGCGTKSQRFSLSECRRALDLHPDSWFHSVLARAELILPDLAQFIYM